MKTKEQILEENREAIQRFIDGDDLPDRLYHELYSLYYQEMPYGTAKARTGDPYEWLYERLVKELHDNFMD